MMYNSSSNLPAQTPQMIKRPSSLQLDWQKFRPLIALLGICLLVTGQILIARETLPDQPASALGLWLNSELHLAIPSVDNILHGLCFLLPGALLLFASLRKFPLLTPDNPHLPSQPLAFKFLRSSWPWLVGGTIVFALLLWQVNTFDYFPAMVIQWLVAPILLAIACARWDVLRSVQLSPSISRSDIVTMLVLFIIGIVLGVFRLQGLPDMLIGDEGSFWTAARDIATGQFSPPVFGNGVYTFPVLSSIGQADIMRLFGIDLWGWRFSSVLAGALTVFPLYLLARDMFDRRIAIISGLALLVSPYFLAFARLGYNNIQSLFITTLALYFLFLGVKRNSIFYSFLAGCAAGMGFYTYFSARMALVIALAFLFFLWILRKVSFRLLLTSLVPLTLGVIWVIGPYFVHGLRYDAEGMSFKVYESVFFNTFNGLQFYSEDVLISTNPLFEFGGNQLFYNPKVYLVLLVRGLVRTLLIFQKPWLISEHFIASPLTGSIGVIFYLIGLGALIKRFKESRSLLVLLWFLVTLLALSVLNTVPPRHTHMVSILPALAILTAVGIHTIAAALGALIRPLARFRTVLLVVISILVAAGGIYDYFILMPARYYPQPDQIVSWASLYADDEALILAYADPAEMDLVRPYLVTEFTPDISYQAIPINELTAHIASLPVSDGQIIFYLPTNATQVEPLIREQWGSTTILRNFFNHNAVPILFSARNIPFVFERDRSLWAVLKDSYLRAPLLIFLGSLGLLLSAVAFLPSRWFSRLPRRFLAATAWLNAPVSTPPPPLPPEDDEEFSQSPPPQPTPPAEPPLWAEEVFAPRLKTPKDKFSLSSRVVKTSPGRDFFLRIHFPTLRLPWPALPPNKHPLLPALDLPAPLLLSLSVILAISAQAAIYFQIFWLGILLYLLSAAGLIFWVVKNPKWKTVLINQARISPRLEIILGSLLLVAIVFFHFYDLNFRVYGLEADETKWTAQSYLSTILKADLGEFASMHYQYLPVDFWVRSIFLRLFGVDFLSARLESAFFSVIAAIFLYLLIRKLTSSPPTALLGTLLYSFSFVELNASHQALHNTTLEPWIMAGLYFLILALQDQKYWQFQVSGIILALGMLTYETFYPTVAIALAFAIANAIRQVIRKQASPISSLKRLALLFWPIVLAYLAFTQRYLQSRHGYHFGWIEQTSAGGSNLGGALEFVLLNGKYLLQTIFSGVVWQDSLLRWSGSFLNQLILPFVFLGLVYNLCNLRRWYLLFIPLWYLVNIAFAPLILGSVWPRVLYTGLAPLLIWGAIGLFLLLAALRPWLEQWTSRLTLPVFITILLLILATDYRIFTTRIADPTDRLVRRELSDLASLSAADTDLLIFLYIPVQNDALELESHVLFFTVAGTRGAGLQATEHYLQLPFDQLLASLWENRTLATLDVFYDKSAFANIEDRTRILDLMLTCYPTATLRADGEYFAVYHLESAALLAPQCYQGNVPVPLSPLDGDQLDSSDPFTFTWDTGDIQPTAFSLLVESHLSGVYLIEAEQAFQSGGWYASSEFTTGFTGEGFLLDNWDSSLASYSLPVDQAGQYHLWVRSFKRRFNDQQNFINFNGQSLDFATSSAPLDQWHWESLGIFDLPSGEIPVALGRRYGQDEMFSVFIDSLLLTSDLTSPPDETRIWQPVLTSGRRTTSLSRFTLPESLPPGEYRWSVRVFDGERLVDSHGLPGITMPYVHFVVLP